MKRRTRFAVPYHRNGDLLRRPNDDPVWRENNQFQATLLFEGVIQDGSHPYYQWRDKDGRAYPMIAREMAVVLGKCVIVKGRTTGLWQVYRFGVTYSLGLVR
jgi:hypothetical protein